MFGRERTGCRLRDTLNPVRKDIHHTYLSPLLTPRYPPKQGLFFACVNLERRAAIFISTCAAPVGACNRVSIRRTTGAAPLLPPSRPRLLADATAGTCGGSL